MASTPNGTKKVGQTVAQQTTAALSKAGGTTPAARKHNTAPAPTKSGAPVAPKSAATTATASQAKSTATAASGAGPTMPSPPKSGVATATSTTKGASPSNGSANKSSSTPNWEALRAQQTNPKVKSKQADSGVALLKFFIENQDESKSTVYRAPPKKDAGQDKKRNTPVVPIFK